MALDGISPKSMTGPTAPLSLGGAALPGNVSPPEEEMPEKRGDEVSLALRSVKRAPESVEAPQEETPTPVQHTREARPGPPSSE